MLNKIASSNYGKVSDMVLGLVASADIDGTVACDMIVKKGCEDGSYGSILVRLLVDLMKQPQEEQEQGREQPPQPQQHLMDGMQAFQERMWADVERLALGSAGVGPDRNYDEFCALLKARLKLVNQHAMYTRLLRQCYDQDGFRTIGLCMVDRTFTIMRMAFDRCDVWTRADAMFAIELVLELALNLKNLCGVQECRCIRDRILSLMDEFGASLEPKTRYKGMFVMDHLVA